MYLSFYHLRHKPFQISTDPRFLWLGEKHEEALATLKYGIADNKGFLLLTGDVGTGKTTLINALLASLDENTAVASIRDPALEILDFFQYTAHAFGMQASAITTKAMFLIQFEEFLQKAYEKKRKVLLIIDEAQRLNQELLEEIRLLSNIEREETKLLNIFFIGQIEFNDILLLPENRAIRQRITVNYDITPLSEKETRQYIQHRLQVASTEKAVTSFAPLEKKENGEYVRQGFNLPLPELRQNIFTNEAIHEVYRFSGGYPRLINIICDRALLTGYVEGANNILRRHIQECAKELEIPKKNSKVTTGGGKRAYQASPNTPPHPPKTSAHMTTGSGFPPTAEENRKQQGEVPPPSPQPGEKEKAGTSNKTVNGDVEQSTQQLLEELERLVKNRESHQETAPQASTSKDDSIGDKEEKRSRKGQFVIAGLLLLATLFYYAYQTNTEFASRVDEIQRQLQNLISETFGEQQTVSRQQPVPQQPEEDNVTAAMSPPTGSEQYQNGAEPQASESAGLAKPAKEEQSSQQQTGSGDIPAAPAKAANDTPQEREELPATSPALPKKTVSNIAPSNRVQQNTQDTPATPQTGQNVKEIISAEQKKISTRIQKLKKLLAFNKLIIPFSDNTNEIPESSMDELNALVESLLVHPSYKVTITHNTFHQNENQAQDQLSSFQAGSIKSYLMGKGLEPTRIQTRGRRRNSPLALSPEDASQSTNMWVEIYVAKQLDDGS